MASLNLEPTPQVLEDFNASWVEPIIKYQLEKEEEFDPHTLQILKVDARKNDLQGILSTTFVVDVDFKAKEVDGDGSDLEEQPVQTKHLFVKVPLKDDVNFASVNTRELIMLTKVLPQLQIYLDNECEGFFRLPMPEIFHCFYDGSGTHDVFVLANLLAEEYENFDETKDFDEDHLKSLLECLAQLHGTGLAYKKKVGNCHHQLKSEFAGLEEQIQLDDVLENEPIRQFFRQHFRAFLHYLEETDPAVANHTGYMKKMHKHILGVIGILDQCGYEKLITICHGDAKPNNFMFRNISIDIEELECEGLQSILIDWQGGFVGSVANDLMWAIFPFLEANQSTKAKMYSTALEYYFEQLCIVLESFNYSMEDLNLPSTFPEFASLLKKCLVLEFIIVTVIKPIMSIPKPKKLLQWHKETERNKRRRFVKTVEKPDYNEVFTSPRFAGFCHLYFKIATSLGAFQELGKIYFDVMKDSMFEAQVDDFDSDVDVADPDMFYRLINAPLPSFPRITLPSICIPEFNVLWRRFKYRCRQLKQYKWIILALLGGIAGILYGYIFMSSY